MLSADLYCPREDRTFPEDKPCEHYTQYGYQRGQNPKFFENLIRQGYIPNSKRERGPSKSQYSGTLKDSVCKRCGKRFNHTDRVAQDRHEEKCRGQTTL